MFTTHFRLEQSDDIQYKMKTAAQSRVSGGVNSMYHVNTRLIASSVLPGGSSSVDAAKLLENSISD